ncbi:MAG: addiction module protein [Granulosicoccus sp.]
MLAKGHTVQENDRISVKVKSLGIDKLDVANRLALIGELWDSVSAETEALPLTTQMKAELDSRIAEADANPDSGVSWDQVKNDAIARLGK